MGSSHIKMFREEAQRAADYLEYQIRGRLVAAPSPQMQSGCGRGGKSCPASWWIHASNCPTATANPDYHALHALMNRTPVSCLAWFELFKQHQGNLKRTWEHIEQHGPFIPELGKGALPRDLPCHSTIRTAIPIHGRLDTVQMDSLRSMLCNAAYIGHWAFIKVLRQRNAITKRLCRMTCSCMPSTSSLRWISTANPNPEYQPYRSMTRHDKSDRPVEPPTYTGVVFSSDIPDLRRNA